MLYLIQKMNECPQTDTQSVMDHGLDVRDHFRQLYKILESGQTDPYWRLPAWIFQYRNQLLTALFPLDIIEEYTLFHDCGKVFCLTYENGKRHFPNHAEISYQTWLKYGTVEAANLMRLDMEIHRIKDKDIDSFILHPEAITLLLVGLCEVHSNSRMFGGMDSDSFKIKWKQINKRGAKICERLFGEVSHG